MRRAFGYIPALLAACKGWSASRASLGAQPCSGSPLPAGRRKDVELSANRLDILNPPVASRIVPHILEAFAHDIRLTTSPRRSATARTRRRHSRALPTL